ncbi:multidrug transporter subunit MdtD [Pseudomonas jinjuensis]|uniref:Drug resistance transporter, EmrB/QacA subfamily n=1 Tax=Pseudomonas jinjuensis TaxID=198616 RepID=A0A1H0IQ92_9PSED|nr:multidrug transporter subunit MdtD [Pseudomonas jinjuensis]SDO33617.1 drug resistance transporter, EmrB/QacA subfamily [Pseudomonas jinjuensis]
MSEPFVLTPRVARLLPWIVAIAFFMQALDGTILNTALPSMARSLNEDPLRMQAVVISYLLTVALLIPASGWLSDRFGTRRVFLFAVLLFSLGSLLCALSPTLGALVASRVVQGLGGALMLPVGRLVILRAYPRSELVRVLSFVTIPGLLGPLTGPTLGGWLVEYASWHWIFLINLPVGLLGFIVAMRLMPDLRGTTRSRFDGPGFLLFGGAMLLVTIALEGLGELHMPHVRVVLLLVGGLVLLAAYWLRALRIEAPLFPPLLFRIRTFAVGVLGNLFARLGSGALPFLTPLLLQVGLGYAPAKAGMTMIPLALSAMLIKPLARPLLELFGYRRLLVGNTLLLGCLIASLGLIDHDTPYLLLLAQLAVLGAVNSLQFTAMNTLTLIDLRDDNASAGNSLLSVVTQLSISMGVACAAALLGGFQGELGVPVGDVLGAFHATYLAVGVMSMLAAAIFFQLGSGDGRTVKSAKVEVENQVSEH